MIDKDLLPKSALLDTGVLIRALRQKADAHAAACQELFDAMILGGSTIYIAAPTLAEVLRKEPDTKIPVTMNVRVVPFDRTAAEVLAEHLPSSVQKAEATRSGLRHTYIKYDALIVSCAKRWGADVIIALDSDHHKLAARVSVPVRRPAEFQEQQQVLKLLPNHGANKNK